MWAESLQRLSRGFETPVQSSKTCICSETFRDQLLVQRQTRQDRANGATLYPYLPSQASPQQSSTANSQAGSDYDTWRTRLPVATPRVYVSKRRISPATLYGIPKPALG
jgi:hypothetical protein